ncbi:MAG: hypothetical protein IJT18_05090 [Oscillospiraceae bacterium]|nr:hypothetical protein [Oscillospiraceae bacterium]
MRRGGASRGDGVRAGRRYARDYSPNSKIFLLFFQITKKYSDFCEKQFTFSRAPFMIETKEGSLWTTPTF